MGIGKSICLLGLLTRPLNAMGQGLRLLSRVPGPFCSVTAKSCLLPYQRLTSTGPDQYALGLDRWGHLQFWLRGIILWPVAVGSNVSR